MDPNQLREIFNLDQKATDEQILAHARQMTEDNTRLTSDLETAQNDLQEANQTISDQADQIQALENTPPGDSSHAQQDGNGGGNQKDPVDQDIQAWSEAQAMHEALKDVD